MTDFNIPAGTTQTVGSLSGNPDTVEGNSTAAYGAGGGTLQVTGDVNGDSITVTGGVLQLDHDANGATITLNNATLDMSGGHTWNNTTTIIFGSGDSGVIVPPSVASSPTLGGVSFTGFNNGDYIDTGSNSPVTNVSYDSTNNILNYTQNGIDYTVNLTFASGVTPNFQTSTLPSGDTVLVQGGVVCFASGTVILTVHGEVAVEELKVGDLVVTRSGEHRPVKWIGHRTLDLRDLPRTDPARPIRIAADAFGPGQPSRDLYISPSHSVCVDLCGETLVLVGDLVNGATIARYDADSITYWHVELDRHDILLANNLAAESYLAMGNRGAFEGEAFAAYADGRDKTHADFCRPVLSVGPVLAFVRQRLVGRAEELGWARARESELRLMVDGGVVRPLTGEGAAAFLFPAGAKDVRLVSNTFYPPSLGSGDQRDLGVMLAGLSFSGSLGGEPRRVSVDDGRLRDGFLPVENHGGAIRRWTKGEASLEPQLWAGLSGQIALLVTYDDKVTRGWIAPAQSQPNSEPADRPRLYAVK